MRLLEIHPENSFSLVDFTGRDTPRYAILSHTWGHDYEEVTFDDFSQGIGTSKPGFRKIEFCAEQAEKDGLKFCWIDTCCIDRANSTELSEAINSMFKWYRKATKCYAYLADVPVSNRGRLDLLSKRSWEHPFRNSRWFTRGWTLQELLAPTSVEFFSSDGGRLGSRRSLRREIHDITGIPVQALHGRSLKQFKIEERTNWIRGRETKREEDIAYSLLGIFDVFIPLIYGEGRESAFRRLEKAISDAGTRFDQNALCTLQPSAVDVFHPNRSIESQWSKLMESRKERGDCFNCGRQTHWEKECLYRCGRCLYRGHSVSNCSFSVRCMKCRQTGHMNASCSVKWRS